MKMFELIPERVWPISVGLPIEGTDLQEVLSRLPNQVGAGVGHPTWVVVAAAEEWHTPGVNQVLLHLSEQFLDARSRDLKGVCDRREPVALFASEGGHYSYKGNFVCRLQDDDCLILSSPDSPTSEWVPIQELPVLAGEERTPFEVDPEEQDRSTRAHQEMVNAIICSARASGLDLCRMPSVPVDVGWFGGSVSDEKSYTIIEVKTVNRDNTNKQLRLAIAQVLDYEAGIELVCPILAGRIRKRIVLFGDNCELSPSLVHLLAKQAIVHFAYQSMSDMENAFEQDLLP